MNRIKDDNQMSYQNENSEVKKDLLYAIATKIPGNIWICLASGMISGLLTHLYMLMHKLPNWDDLNNFHGYGSGDSWGRWFLKYVRPLSGEWSIPAINGVMAIFIIAVSSCLIIAALDLKSLSAAILVPVMAVTFPGFTSTMTFMFTVNSYAMGILLSCLGAFLIRKYKYGYIPAIFVFLLSLGIYQSYICLAAGILVLGLLIDLIDKEDTRTVIFKGIISMMSLGVGMVAYVIVSKIATPVLDDSQGINEMGHVEILRIPRLIMRCYKRITEYFIIEPYSFVSNGMHVVNIAICLTGFFLFIYIVINKQLYKDKFKCILAVILAMLVPFSLASIYALAPDTQDAAMTMLYQYFFIYVVIIALAEKALPIDNQQGVMKTEEKQAGRITFVGKVLAYVGVILIIIVGYQNYLISNEAYFRMYLSFERVSAYYNRIVMSVEAEDEYEYGDSLVIAGNVYPEKYVVGYNEMGDERFKEFSGIATENGMLTEGIRVGFLRTYLGIEVPDVNWDEVRKIKKTAEYDSMPYYPKDGSIQKIDGIWIVKLCEDLSNS